MSQRALITGCSSGIGRALAAELVNRGYEVIATARRIEAISELPAALHVQLDVTDDESVARVIAQAGRVDVLINNAGIGAGGPSEAVPLSVVQQIFDTNVFGPIRMMQAVLPQMRERGSGTIVNISSIAARVPWPFGAYYAASKAALESVSEALDIETAELGLRVILVEPGVIDTSLVGKGFTLYGGDLKQYEELGKEWGAHFVGQFPGPELVATAVSDALASSVTKLRVEVGDDATRVLEMRRSLEDEELEDQFRGFFKMRPRAGRQPFLPRT